MSTETLSPPPPLKQGLHHRLRPLWLGGIVLLVVLKIVALSPAPLEDNGVPPRFVNLDELLSKEENSLAPGIPKGKVPDYTIDQFNYVSTHNGEKQWNLVANEALFFNAEKLVHSKVVKANLYDSEGKITVLTGLEAKYAMNDSVLEVFGDAKAIMPDGFIVSSQYMRYLPKVKRIEVPVSYPTEGDGEQKPGQKMHFNSRGLNFEMEKGEIYLPADVKFITKERDTQTILYSDHCLIHRKENLADFTMHPERPDKQRFVQIEQPTMYAKGRTGKLKYGSAPNLLQTMTLFDDVLVQEFSVSHGVKAVSRYGTGGRGDFDNLHNLVVLTIYPQVYQDDDTVTGDKITMHRASDIIEVEHSNGFSTGNNDPDASRP